MSLFRNPDLLKIIHRPCEWFSGGTIFFLWDKVVSPHRRKPEYLLGLSSSIMFEGWQMYL